MMNFNMKNLLNPVGKFYLEIFEDGKLIESYEDRNLIVNGGRDAIAKLIGAANTNADKRITQIAFGTNGADPIITDSAITAQFAKAIDGVAYPATETVEISFTLGSGENNGVTIREFGLLCADNTLFARKIRASIEKTSAITSTF